MDMPSELLDGYRYFKGHRFLEEADRYRAVAHEQKPQTMIIGCADSRVDPAAIFSAAPGDLFIVRNVAALVPPYEETGKFHGTSAALEFAVNALLVKNIIVLGHGRCGGVAASLAIAENKPVGQFIRPWVEIIANTRDEMLSQTKGQSTDQQQLALEYLSIKQSLKNLQTFSFVKDALSAGHLTLYGAWFSISDAELRWLNNQTGSFDAIDNLA